MRNEILALRRDPAANAAMAGAFTQRNAAGLGQRIGRKPTDGELYMAHFFGTGGAGQLINAAKDRPQANASAIFPAAARANKSIFYDRQGSARSVAGVYSELNRRYQVARANVLPGVAPTAIAANTAAPSATPAAPDTAGTTQAFAVAAPRPVVAAAEPTFRSLFQNPGRGAVSPLVSELWTTPTESPDPVPDSAPTVTAQAVTPARAQEPLDLFRDMRPDVRSLFRATARRPATATVALEPSMAVRLRAVGRGASSGGPSTIPKIYGERFIKHRPLQWHPSRAVLRHFIVAPVET